MTDDFIHTLPMSTNTSSFSLQTLSDSVRIRLAAGVRACSAAAQEIVGKSPERPEHAGYTRVRLHGVDTLDDLDAFASVVRAPPSASDAEHV